MKLRIELDLEEQDISVVKDLVEVLRLTYPDNSPAAIFQSQPPRAYPDLIEMPAGNSQAT